MGSRRAFCGKHLVDQNRLQKDPCFQSYTFLILFAFRTVRGLIGSRHLSHHVSKSCHQGPLFQCDALTISVRMHFLLGHWLWKAKLLETVVHCTVTCASSTSFLWCVRVCVCENFYQISFRSLAWVASDIEEVDELEEELSSSTFSPLAFACFLIFFCNFFLATLETDTIKSNHCHHCHGIAKPNNEPRVKRELTHSRRIDQGSFSSPLVSKTSFSVWIPFSFASLLPS